MNFVSNFLSYIFHLSFISRVSSFFSDRTTSSCVDGFLYLPHSINSLASSRSPLWSTLSSSCTSVTYLQLRSTTFILSQMVIPFMSLRHSQPTRNLDTTHVAHTNVMREKEKEWKWARERECTQTVDLWIGACGMLVSQCVSNSDNMFFFMCIVMTLFYIRRHCSY